MTPHRKLRLSVVEESPIRKGGSGMRGTTGDLAHVVAELDDLSEQYAADHFGIVTICYHFKARLHSYELLAKAYLHEETAEANDDERT